MINLQEFIHLRGFLLFRPFLLNSFTTSRCYYKKNYYEVLQLSKTCSSKEIRDSYLKLSKRYHPDTNSSNSHVNGEKFVELNEAYTTLSKPESRNTYDLTIFSKAQPKENNSHGFAENDVGDVTSHHSFRQYYYNAYEVKHQPQPKPRINTLKFTLFLLIFTAVGGALQFCFIKWAYHKSFKNEVERHRLSPAALAADKHFEEMLSREKTSRAPRFKLNNSPIKPTEKDL